jgi:hypothetical protein
MPAEANPESNATTPEGAVSADAEREHLYTTEQYDRLSVEERRVLDLVARCLTGECVEARDAEALTVTFNTLRPCEGCLPEEEIGEDLLADIRRKFACIYYPAVELAEEALKEKGLRHVDDFAFCMDIDPNYEDSTHVAIVDYLVEERPFCYLHVYEKAWHFSFATLQAIAEEVLKARGAILAAYQRLVEKPQPNAHGESNAKSGQ